jgi:hypothetical protein
MLIEVGRNALALAPRFHSGDPARYGGSLLKLLPLPDMGAVLPGCPNMRRSRRGWQQWGFYPTYSGLITPRLQSRSPGPSQLWAPKRPQAHCHPIETTVQMLSRSSCRQGILVQSRPEALHLKSTTFSATLKKERRVCVENKSIEQDPVPNNTDQSLYST